MSAEIIQAIEELAEAKNLPKELLIDAIEASLISAYKKSYPDANSVKVNFNRETGEVSVYNVLLVVKDMQAALDIKYQDFEEGEEVEIPDTILLEEAREYIPEIQPGDSIEKEVTPDNFGRIATLTAKQVILQRIREAERKNIFDKYSKKIGDIVSGRVQRVSRQEAFVQLQGTMAKIMKEEQIDGEYFDTRSPNEQEELKFLVIDVIDPSDERYEQDQEAKKFNNKKKRKDKSILIFLSRTRKELVGRLFEMEVTELQEGIVVIKSIARRAGIRSKMAVHALDMNVDAVGACVGQRGDRVQRVVNALKGEKIDIVKWSENPAVFIANALSPANALKVDLDEEKRRARVMVSDSQLSLAIGQDAINVSLAAELTGYSIDIYTESEAHKVHENDAEETGEGDE